MMGEDPDVNLLVALRALLEEVNVTRAGERLRMGQSSMSAALARLRKRFDDELLVRVGRDYELTPLARQLLPQVQATVPLVERVFDRDPGFNPELSRRRVAIQLTDYAAVEIRPVLAEIARGAPSLRIDLRRGPSEPRDAERDLLAYDFVIAPPGASIDVESIELFRDSYVVVADRDNAAIAGGSIAMEDFVRLPHARADMRHVVTPVQRRMRELDISVEIRAVTSSQLPLPVVVAGTELLAVIPRRLALRAAQTMPIVFVPTPFDTVELIERIWWHPGRVHDLGHEWLRKVIAATVERGLLTP